ncbi:hypothetical protein [Cellulomonas aerilata]|uniref:Uncharacterized protein n=1 Tax=Cellulomonas aerilata TaxID=515326 RepID=A0A512DFV2_9CELL|nr:hypothetical protein [Cellulomonas aerilata]GEO35359.1 hypothetical protein CAE01nite_30840 [Cellulomonas aerilata]
MSAPADLLTLPRSVLLALWVERVGAGSGPLQSALDAVQGEDEPHTVRLGEGADASGEGLAGLLAAWCSGPRDVAAVLPAPGDLTGVPAAAGRLSVDAGECVLVHGAAGSFAAVPVVEEFGSALEPGYLVTWEVRAVPDWRTRLLGTLGSLAESERDLRQALISATEALASLDVARWRPDAAEAIASLRGDTPVRWPVPDGLDGRRLRVLVTAARLRAIVALATSDDGGAVNLWQADQRSAALREVDRAARRAMSAATATPGQGPSAAARS